MYVIDVIPISRGMNKETLSYFSSQELELGAVVDVPLRKSMVKGIVARIENVRDRKTDIKTAAFSYKKIENVTSNQFFSAGFLNACVSTAEYQATTTAAVLDVAIPQAIRDELENLNPPQKTTKLKKGTVSAIQSVDEDRYSAYKSIIRQAFARKESVVVCAPTIEDAERLQELTSKGLEDYCHLLHSGTSKKKLIKTWNTIHPPTEVQSSKRHNIVLFTTPAFLVAMPSDTSTVIFERENHRAYKIPRRPHLDFRLFAENVAKEKGLNLIYGDMPLRTETLWRIATKEIQTEDPFSWKAFSTAAGKLVDMKVKDGGTFKILSDEVKELITRTKDESEHMFIFAARRGSAPSTYCGDCHSIVTCTRCSSPVVLHQARNSQPYFLCHRCGERRSAEETCKVCDSWKLVTVGIGIDLVEQKIRDSFPDVALFKIDSDSVKNEKEARKIVMESMAKPGSILLGTEMALAYWTHKVAFSAVISLDSLFSLPDFRIQEKVFSLLTTIKARTTKDLIIQTRKPDEPALAQAISGSVNHFYESEISLRKDFGYPPFTVLIKLTLEGKRDQIVKEMQDIQAFLAPYEIDVFPAFTHTVKDNSLLHGLIRLPAEEWIDEELARKLKALPPSVTVKVDPESLL